MTEVKASLNRDIITLIVALIIDFVGLASYLFPSLGELFDGFWAPISALLVYLLFGRKLSWASFTFIEELFPYTDIIPSATLAWYFYRRRNSSDSKNVAEIYPMKEK